jgi:hypothetical protein
MSHKEHCFSWHSINFAASALDKVTEFFRAFRSNCLPSRFDEPPEDSTSVQSGLADISSLPGFTAEQGGSKCISVDEAFIEFGWTGGVTYGGASSCGDSGSFEPGEKDCL